MKVNECALQNVLTSEGGGTPLCVGFISNALPETQSSVAAESSQTGVSTKNALS